MNSMKHFRSGSYITPGKSGFTLIELLVVIAIIGLIIGILIPALGGARRESRVAPCAANLRAVGQAMGAYLNQSKTYPASYVYGAEESGHNWNMQDQGGTHPQPQNGYIHWSSILLGDGLTIPEAAFRCSAAPKGGAPATNPGGDVDDWDTELGQTNALGQSTPPAPPKDRQAERMAYVANAAVMPRNKLNSSSGRHNRLVQDSLITRADKTILATELVHNGDWSTVLDGTVSRSHRPITPFLGVNSGDDVYQQPENTNGPAYMYPARTTIVARSAIRPDMLGFGRNPINAVGRSHPGGGKFVGGTANFVFVDGHVERMSVLDSLDKKLWGDKFYSMTGTNTSVRMTP